ncbi:hypothetical protein LVJ94_51205 [Pendulispora rubella]|uniref:Uncharacterized protein n=1 Tax=Pendulispora rubella TaxID=2741070 RepID=A0ABZ2L2W1_9BACT
MVVEAWETWEDVDGRHTAHELERLSDDLFTALDLGLDVDALLTITDYPIESDSPYFVHDTRALNPVPEAVSKKRRLTRSR